MLLRTLLAWLLARLARLAWRSLTAYARHRAGEAAGRLRRLLP